MKYALISPLEIREKGHRVAEVSNKAHEVAEPFYWVNCPDNLVADTIWYNEETKTFEEFALVTSVASPVITTLTPLQFINLFTDAEQLAIVTATMKDPRIKLWYDKLLISSSISLADPQISVGLDFLVEDNLITIQRKNEILPPKENK